VRPLAERAGLWDESLSLDDVDGHTVLDQRYPLPSQEPVGLANDRHIFFEKFHLDGRNLPRQAP
jgi:hypothetical protein